MRPHVTDFYMDGFQVVQFCKVCSAEGLQLVEKCSGHLSELVIKKGNIGGINEKALDLKKQSVK